MFETKLAYSGAGRVYLQAFLNNNFKEKLTF